MEKEYHYDKEITGKAMADLTNPPSSHITISL